MSRRRHLPRTVSALIVSTLFVVLFNAGSAAQEHAHHHGMQLDTVGMVMNENTDQLPGVVHVSQVNTRFTVRAGKEFARPGTMFAL